MITGGEKTITTVEEVLPLRVGTTGNFGFRKMFHFDVQKLK